MKDWHKHKKLCELLKAKIEMLKQASDKLPTILRLTLADMKSKIKKWVQVSDHFNYMCCILKQGHQYYLALLIDSYMEALKIWHEIPIAYLTHLLAVYVALKFTTKTALQKTRDIWIAFGVADAKVILIKDLVTMNPNMGYTIKIISKKVKKNPDKQYQRLALVYIATPEYSIGQLVPSGLNHPSKKPPP